MFSQTTRLEMIIAVAAMLLMWVCSRAPKSGNAETRLETLPNPQETPLSVPLADSSSPPPARTSPSAADASVSSATTDAAAGTLSDVNTVTATAPAAPRIRRIGVVDARDCDKLNYSNVLYGEVCVRPVWNGQKFVPRTVCVVRESSGISSVWTFDEQDNVKLTEIQEPIEPTP